MTSLKELKRLDDEKKARKEKLRQAQLKQHSSSSPPMKKKAAAPVEVVQKRSGTTLFSNVSGLIKTATRSDTEDNQNRFQLLKSDMAGMTQLQEIKMMVDGGSTVKVLVFDKVGRKYPMDFKLVSNKYYRFMGKGWKDFRNDNSLKVGHKIEVRGPPNDVQVGDVEYCLCFITLSEGEDVTSINSPPPPPPPPPPPSPPRKIHARKSTTPRRSPFF